MLKMLMTLMLMSIVSISLMTLCTIISKNTILDREKMSPFECGFDPKAKARMPFSLQFFLIAVLFLIFDVEIVIILPMIITMKMSNPLYWTITVIVFITTLIISLYYEWKSGMLEWTV
uniref:NADH-ubiquinone oxidoreductase chain 3 n=1 Tax=Largus sp. TaxID=2931298 RepID=A0A8T9ZW89_9HEMI|nr:NADH dehydrogenase subunit 3 [Largus sp.]